MIRRGLFGGTFDPIHDGHLEVARAARRVLGLDEVVFLPANHPPHRSAPHASAAHRFAMVAIAIAGEDGFRVSDLELQSAGPSYTTDTLDRLTARGEDTRRLCLVTGADAFRDIASWKGYPQLLDRCHFAVVSRPDCAAPSLRAALPALASRMRDASKQLPPEPVILLVDAPTAAVSSTLVRKRLAAGGALDGLVPSGVAAHIARHRLYTAASTEEI